MGEISRTSLFAKLNTLAYKAVEGATVFCKLRGNPYVELVHWIHQILNTPDSDLHRIVRHFELDQGRLATDITSALDRLPRGATSISDLSSHLENAVERAAILTEGEVLEPGHLGLDPSGRAGGDLEAFRRTVGMDGGLDAVGARARDLAERILIRSALRDADGNKTRAAQILDVPYKRLLARIRELGLELGDDASGRPSDDVRKEIS